MFYLIINWHSSERSTFLHHWPSWRVSFDQALTFKYVVQWLGFCLKIGFCSVSALYLLRSLGEKVKGPRRMLVWVLKEPALTPWHPKLTVSHTSYIYVFHQSLDLYTIFNVRYIWAPIREYSVIHCECSATHFSIQFTTDFSWYKKLKKNRWS